MAAQGISHEPPTQTKLGRARNSGGVLQADTVCRAQAYVEEGAAPGHQHGGEEWDVGLHSLFWLWPMAVSEAKRHFGPLNAWRPSSYGIGTPCLLRGHWSVATSGKQRANLRRDNRVFSQKQDILQGQTLG